LSSRDSWQSCDGEWQLKYIFNVLGGLVQTFPTFFNTIVTNKTAAMRFFYHLHAD
jgi:hypothetical protein